jgi:hypothetical protein
LIKIVASFLPKVTIVCINYDDQSRFEFNVCVLNTPNLWHVRVMENLMPRFYFNLASKDAYIPDDFGKELDTLHDAYMHARKFIDKILFHVGHDDGQEWKVVILNDEHDAQMIVPLSVSHTFNARHRKTG